MRNALAALKFSLSRSDVFEKFGSFKQAFVLLDIQQYSGTLTMLSQYQGAAGFSNLLYKRSCIGTKLGKRANISAETYRFH